MSNLPKTEKISGVVTGDNTVENAVKLIETGIHNSGLGLILIFSFFNGLGGMALITAWWGIWHLIAGSSLAYYWNKKAIPEWINPESMTL